MISDDMKLDDKAHEEGRRWEMKEKGGWGEKEAGKEGKRKHHINQM